MNIIGIFFRLLSNPGSTIAHFYMNIIAWFFIFIILFMLIRYGAFKKTKKIYLISYAIMFLIPTLPYFILMLGCESEGCLGWLYLILMIPSLIAGIFLFHVLAWILFKLFKIEDFKKLKISIFVLISILILLFILNAIIVKHPLDDDDAWAQEAIEHNDTTMCNWVVTDLFDKEESLNGKKECLKKAAQQTLNTDFCYQIEILDSRSVHIADSCLKDIAISTDNAKLCEETGNYKEECKNILLGTPVAIDDSSLLNNDNKDQVKLDVYVDESFGLQFSYPRDLEVEISKGGGFGNSIMIWAPLSLGQGVLMVKGNTSTFAGDYDNYMPNSASPMGTVKIDDAEFMKYYGEDMTGQPGALMNLPYTNYVFVFENNKSKWIEIEYYADSEEVAQYFEEIIDSFQFAKQ